MLSSSSRTIGTLVAGILLSALACVGSAAAAGPESPGRVFEIRPLLEPRLLRYGAVAGLKGTHAVLVQSRVGGEVAKENMEVAFDLEIEAQDDKRLWRYTMRTLEWGDQSLTPDVPIFVVERETDPAGTIRTSSMTAPYLQSLGKGAAETPEEKAFVERMKNREQSFPPLPTKPISFGDLVRRTPADELFGDLLPASAWKGEVIAGATGLTTIGGRDHLVVVHWGAMEGMMLGGPVAGAVSGLSLIDMETALTTRSSVHGFLKGTVAGEEASILISVTRDLEGLK